MGLHDTTAVCVGLLQLTNLSAASKCITPTSFREYVEGEIERLIALVDAIDGDPELEDGADAEPYLAHVPGCQDCRGDDREGDVDDDREPDVDGEHSLGWRDEGSQLLLGVVSDLEDDNDSGIADFAALSFERQDEKDRQRFKRLSRDERNAVSDLHRLAVRMKYGAQRHEPGLQIVRLVSMSDLAVSGVRVG